MALKDFIATVKTTGLASPNLYSVDISVPKTVQFSTRQDLEMIQLFCDQAQLPDQTITTTPTRTYGEVREMPYENLYGNITMSFYVDSEYKVKSFFDDWIQSITDKDTRHMNYYDDYIAPEIKIIMLNKEDKAKYMVTLYECYPKQISAVSLDAASKDVVKVTVSMNYKYWRSYPVVDQTEGTNIRSRNIFNRLGLVPEGSLLDRQINSVIDIIPKDYFSSFDDYQQSISTAWGDAQSSFTGGVKDFFSF